MENEKGNSKDYFNNAIGNFMHEMSGAGAIRHMTDQGYSVRQIMEKLDYPTSLGRVEETVLKYMLKKGILLESLPSGKSMDIGALSGTDTEKNTVTTAGYRQVRIPHRLDKRQLSEEIYSRKENNGEDMSYILLFPEKIKGDQKLLTCLNDRERDYITGLPWKSEAAGHPIKPFVYHRITGRMYEIALELSIAIVNGNCDSLEELRFYFIDSREEMIV